MITSASLNLGYPYAIKSGVADLMYETIAHLLSLAFSKAENL